VLLEAEAIVPIDDTLRYLGVGEATGKECQLAYHHFLMVLLWSALAEGNAGLLTGALQRLPAIPVSGSWCTYMRSHDDIGWAITPADSATVGLDDFLHRQFLTDFYIGDVPGSFAIGQTFQYNPKTQDRRVSGSAASLAGVERALRDDDPLALEMAYRRLRLLAGIIAGAGGIPLIWSGDELGLTNDYSYLEDPERAADNRWLHRPALTDEALACARDRETVAGRAFGDLRQVLAARRSSPEVHAAAASDAVHTGNGAVFGLLRSGPRGRILILANFTPHPQSVHAAHLGELGFSWPLGDRLTGREVPAADTLDLEPYGVMWLAPS
jgi:amylosucrase